VILGHIYVMIKIQPDRCSDQCLFKTTSKN